MGFCVKVLEECMVIFLNVDCIKLQDFSISSDKKEFLVFF